MAVAAALAHDPSVVLADEPTGELDAVAADEVYDLLVRAVERSGAALVLVTHDERAQRIAHRVVRIRDGRLGEEWLPGGDERLVVDDRGWVRLPEPMRRTTGDDARRPRRGGHVRDRPARHRRGRGPRSRGAPRR